MKSNLSSIAVSSGFRSFAGRSVSILSLALLCSLGLLSASAGTLTWTGAISSDWNNRTNWNPQQVPTSSDTAVVNSGNVTLAANSQFSVLNLNGGYLYGPVLVATGSGSSGWSTKARVPCR